MIKPENLKQMLDNTSAMIPEMLKTTNSNTEELAALNAVLILNLDWLETLAEDTKHPDFDVNFRMVREKIFEVINLINERLWWIK